MSYDDGELWHLNGKQWLSITESFAFINVWEGAVRSGKTFATLERWLIYIARDAPSGNLLLTGNTKDTIYRNLIQPLEEFWPGMVKYKQGANVCIILGRPCFVIGAKDDGSEKRLRGLTLAGALVDEITIMPHNFFKMLTSRLSKGRGKLFGTTNPDSPRHWLKVEYLDSPNRKKLPNWVHTWHFDLDDNHTLDEDFKNNLKAGYSGLFYKRFIQLLRGSQRVQFQKTKL
jgi:PBSX family phage terminase large subunit